MKGRILGAALVSIAVLGLALAAFLRGPAPSVSTDPIQKPPVVRTSPEPDWNSHPLSSFRVYEDETPGGMDFKGVGYQAQVTSSGLTFRTDEFSIGMSASRLEQGDRSIELGRGPVRRSAFGRAHVDHQVMAEEYIFENSRVEQVFRIPVAIGTGALRVRTTVQTTLTGPVTDEGQSEWREAPFNGLAFRDGNGDKKLAYHSAVAIDAAGRRCRLHPQYDSGQIVLEVPAPFMASASWPVVIDPWLELNFSSTGGGLSNTSTVSQTPALAIEGGGNPYVAWAEESGGDFEIFLRYWNGFSWFSLGTSASGGGISNNTGNSTNPTIALVPTGEVFVAWEDDTSGNMEIYLKKWTGTTWSELGGSASKGGVSTSTGESTNPSVAYMRVLIPSTGAEQDVPAVAWQDTVTGPTTIHLAAYYPGDPGRPDDPTTGFNENFPVIPSGWYGMGGSYTYSLPPAGVSRTSGGSVSERPSLAIYGTSTSGRVAHVAWQDTRAGNYEICYSQHSIPNDTSAQLPVYSLKRDPDFSTGALWTTTPQNVSNTVAGTVSATSTGLSINPSLALSITGVPYITWEESASSLDTEVFARYGSGAWNPVGTTVNVSQTPATGLVPQRSTTPCIAVSPTGVVYVAWSDDSTGNSEIFVKKCMAAGAAWISVGLDSSFGPSASNPQLGGISRNSSASLFPAIKAGAAPVVAWQDFNNGQFEIYLLRYFENEPRALRQTWTSGATTTVVPTGGTAPVPTLELRGTLFSEETSRLVRMQVEVRPIDSDFVGTVTAQGDLLSVDATTHLTTTEAVVNFTGLVNVTYHWRARTVDDIGRPSAWISYGGNADGLADFTISTTMVSDAPTGLTATAGNGQVTLSWNTIAGASNYTVYRSTQATTGYGSIALPTTNSYTDLGVTNGTTYYYTVSATVSSQETNRSDPPVSATPSSVPGSLAGGDDDDKRHCGLMGAEALLLLGLLALIRRKKE